MYVVSATFGLRHQCDVNFFWRVFFLIRMEGLKTEGVYCTQ